ncbi:hypothetical protein VTK73DRAFT_7234 [Phialemonium thermophilum]|uniref:Uncharacterized protein n=1 Tax=Phialemonium thermophilum TaxID=223376 RepID=A0ABR3WGB6_9PEZI
MARFCLPGNEGLWSAYDTHGERDYTINIRGLSWEAGIRSADRHSWHAGSRMLTGRIHFCFPAHFRSRCLRGFP